MKKSFFEGDKMEIVKYGLVYNGFFIDMLRALNNVPEFDAGFYLKLKRENSVDTFWVPHIKSVTVYGKYLSIIKSNNMEFIFTSDEIKAYQIVYDEDMAEYNGECIDEETKKLFELSTWEENFSIV